MSLTVSERAAGRKFRDSQQAALTVRNDEDPPDLIMPPLVRHVRHECPGYRYNSVSFDFAEHYVFSPAYWVTADGGVFEAGRGEIGKERTFYAEAVGASRFAFVYHEGRCRRCTVTARSATGRVVDPRERAPSQRAVVLSG